MKRLLAVSLALLAVVYSSLCASAAKTDYADTGKNVVTIGDWVLEKVDNGTHWEADEYVGPGGEVLVPWRISDIMVVSLGDHCFANNTSVTSVITTSPPWSIGEYCFIDCSALEKVELNNMMSNIGVGAFSGTSSLKDINLQNSIVTEIKAYTFLNSGIKEVELPATCTTLGAYSFGQCTQLEKITIPASVSTIHEDAFKGSNNLTIYCYTDSAAHLYAERKNIPYVLIDAVQPTQAPTEVPTTQRGYLLGDVNDDESVDTIDATLILRHCADIMIPCTQEQLMQGDVDDDTDVSVIDATFILRYSAEISTPYSIGEFVFS